MRKSRCFKVCNRVIKKKGTGQSCRSFYQWKENPDAGRLPHHCLMNSRTS